jgi:betaine-aldehyde dehydrogenase
VEAARRAFPAWAKTGCGRPWSLAAEVADAIEASAEELAKLESIDTGHPLRDTRGWTSCARR